MSVKRFTINTDGRDYVVGDIHGCYSKLKETLHQIQFEPSRDRLFSVGDLVDRGPENTAVHQWLSFPWFHPVMGNHDDMARRWPKGNMELETYRRNGGGWNIDQHKNEQIRTSDAMAGLSLAIEVETELGVVGIVHADVSHEKWEQFVAALSGTLGEHEKRRARRAALYSRERITSENRWGIQGVRAVVVGHTPVDKPVQLGNVYHIDTGAVFDRDFTILELASLEPVYCR